MEKEINYTNNKYLRRYMILSIIYASLALIAGVFYREFTKFNNFSSETTLSLIHTHYFVLGMFFFLILLLLEKSFSFSSKNDNTNKKVGISIILYNIGLNLTSIMLLVRGILEVISFKITSKIDGVISGVAGVGHILLGISLLFILIFIFIDVFRKKKEINK